MKSKFNNLLLMIFGLFTVLFISACTTTSIIQITFLQTPEDIYFLGQNNNKVSAEIEIFYTNGTSQKANLETASTFGVKVSGATFNSTGKYTLVVSYGAISASYEYTVVEKDSLAYLFNGGTGAEDDPYQIVNPVQLSNIRYDLDAHYQLKDNIDLDGFDWIPIGSVVPKVHSSGGYYYEVSSAFSGSLSGKYTEEGVDKSYQISNLNRNEISENSGSMGGLFYVISGKPEEKNPANISEGYTLAKDDRARVEYIDLVGVEISVGNPGGLAGGIYFAEIDHVKVTGTLKGRAIGGIANKADDTRFTNCTVDIKAIFTDPASAALFGGGIAGQITNSGKAGLFNVDEYNSGFINNIKSFNIITGSGNSKINDDIVSIIENCDVTMTFEFDKTILNGNLNETGNLYIGIYVGQIHNYSYCKFYIDNEIYDLPTVLNDESIFPDNLYDILYVSNKLPTDEGYSRFLYVLTNNHKNLNFENQLQLMKVENNIPSKIAPQTE